MANLTIDPADVAVVESFEQYTGPAAEAVDAGELVRFDTTSGMFTLANASSAAEGRVWGMAANSAGASEALTVIKRGIMDLGDALDAEDFDEQLNLSDTDGKLDDGDGSPTANYPVGRVVPGWSNTAADRLLHVDIPA